VSGIISADVATLIQLFGLAASAGSAIAVLYLILRKPSEPEETATPTLSPRLSDAGESLIPVVVYVPRSMLPQAASSAQARPTEQAERLGEPQPPTKGKLVSRVTGKDEKKSA
jgi:hypothetical protein